MKKLTNNSKGFGTVEVILVLVIVALIGIAGWFVYKNHNRTTNNSTATSTAPTTTTTQPTTKTTVDPYAGWKTYTHNGSNSFSVQYPNDYTVDTGAVDSTADTTQGHLLGTLDIDSWAIKNGQAVSTSTCSFVSNEGIPTCAVKVEVSIFSKVTKNLSDWIKSLQSSNPTSSTNITIDGQSAKKNVYKDDSIAGGHFTGYYYRSGDKGVELIVMPEATKLADTAEKIVTSFKLN